MPDQDVFQRAVYRATESATLAAELGRSVAEIADALAQAFRRLMRNAAPTIWPKR